MRIARAVTLGRCNVAFVAITQKVDAIHRLGVDAPAEVHELVSAHAIGFLAAPDIIAHPRPPGGRADSFAPFVITTEQAAKAQHAWHKAGGGLDEVFSPIVPVVIP